jgi:hypothetical protein
VDIGADESAHSVRPERVERIKFESGSERRSYSLSRNSVMVVSGLTGKHKVEALIPVKLVTRTLTRLPDMVVEDKDKVQWNPACFLVFCSG